MDIAAIIATVTTIVNEIVAVAPIIEKDVTASQPYVQALVGLVSGSNATQDQLDQAVAAVQAASAQLQQPLPPDDGTTTT